jgi:type II secretory pathway pseudopilin PulG
VKPITRQSDKKPAFTIVEILTVMSITVILITLLVPSLNMARRYAKTVRQRAQFHSIGMALDAFAADWDGYPPSEADPNYCGAMKLTEAMVGQDLLGFHPSSRFRGDGTDGSGNNLYPAPPDPENLKSRKGPYLPLENANAYKLKYLYTANSANYVGNFNGDRFVLCDVYGRVTLKPSGTPDVQTVSGKAGMPILYYKANVQGTTHPVNTSTFSNGVGIPTTDPDLAYFYNHLNNEALVELGMPWDTTGAAHPMAAEGLTDLRGNPTTPYNFYNRIWDAKVTSVPAGPFRPYRSDSYILLSAGFDGEYGTADDIFNFEPTSR